VDRVHGRATVARAANGIRKTMMSGLPPQNLAAPGRSPPVLGLEGCFGGVSIDGEVVPRRSHAARETTAIWIFGASSCGNASPAPIRRPCQRLNIRSEAV
jgi:hypothetical protein